MNMKLFENKRYKFVRSENYNYSFRKTDGYFARWGKTIDDDPDFSPFGPEILDLEISVNGCPNGCQHCYKNATNDTAVNMTFDTFVEIFNKVNRHKILTQIAFGITGIQTNTDFIKMMEYSRKNGVIPNFTLTGIDLTDELAEKCSKLVGALAVSINSSNNIIQ